MNQGMAVAPIQRGAAVAHPSQAGAPLVPASGLDRAFDMTKYLAGIATPEALAQAKALSKAYDMAVDALLSENDYQDAENGRRFKKKSAWRKLGRHFLISTEVLSKQADWRPGPDGKPYYYAEVTVRGTAPWGQVMEATAACDTMEGRFRGANARAKAGNDCLATAETRATNRAISNLIAAGEVSAEEMETERHAGADVGDGEAEVPFLERLIGFGKHKDLSWAEAIEKQRGWVQWAVDNAERLTAEQKAELVDTMNGARADDHEELVAKLKHRFETYPRVKFFFQPDADAAEIEETVGRFLPKHNKRIREDRSYAKAVLKAIDEAIENAEMDRTFDTSQQGQEGGAAAAADPTPPDTGATPGASATSPTPTGSTTKAPATAEPARAADSEAAYLDGVMEANDPDPETAPQKSGDWPDDDLPF